MATRVGFDGGWAPNPSYVQVCTGSTGHTEVVRVTYDPKVVSYARLLEVFFAQSRSNMMGEKIQYRSVIFYLNEAQHKAALAALAKRPKSPPTLTAIERATPFYEAEEYHQHYFQKHNMKSCAINTSANTGTGSGASPSMCALPGPGAGVSACALPSQPATSQVSPLKKVRIFTVASGKITEVPVVKKSEQAWRAQLTKEQFHILREGGTETPFHNAFWDNHAEGIYRCAACGADLFSSSDKYNSGTGWPSFDAPVSQLNVTEVTDDYHGMKRTEVRCTCCGSHLGHVFDDGPDPTGRRYCIDSGALTFVPTK